MRRRRRGDIKSPSMSDTEYFSDSADQITVKQPAEDGRPSLSEQFASDVDSVSEDSDGPTASGSALPPPAAQLSGEQKVPAETDLSDTANDSERAWYEFDLSVVLALLSPIANWLTGSDYIKNILLLLLLVFYLHQIIEGGSPLSHSPLSSVKIKSFQSLGAFIKHQDHAARFILCQKNILPSRTSIIAPLCPNCARSRFFISPYRSCLPSLARHSSAQSSSPLLAHRPSPGSVYRFLC